MGYDPRSASRSIDECHESYRYFEFSDHAYFKCTDLHAVKDVCFVYNIL